MNDFQKKYRRCLIIAHLHVIVQAPGNLTKCHKLSKTPGVVRLSYHKLLSCRPYLKSTVPLIRGQPRVITTMGQDIDLCIITLADTVLVFTTDICSRLCFYGCGWGFNGQGWINDSKASWRVSKMSYCRPGGALSGVWCTEKNTWPLTN